MYLEGPEVFAGQESVRLCSVFRVPFVKISACSKAEQLMSAKSNILPPQDLTGRHPFPHYGRLHL